MFDHIFSDNWFTGVESGITDFNGRKTGLFIPFWLADRFSDGLEVVEWGKKEFFGYRAF
jgi:hypothetical protein